MLRRHHQEVQGSLWKIQLVSAQINLTFNMFLQTLSMSLVVLSASSALLHLVYLPFYKKGVHIQSCYYSPLCLFDTGGTTSWSLEGPAAVTLGHKHIRFLLPLAGLYEAYFSFWGQASCHISVTSARTASPSRSVPLARWWQSPTPPPIHTYFVLSSLVSISSIHSPCLDFFLWRKKGSSLFPPCTLAEDSVYSTNWLRKRFKMIF